jgi:hypothetical protein
VRHWRETHHHHQELTKRISKNGEIPLEQIAPEHLPKPEVIPLQWNWVMISIGDCIGDSVAIL